MKRLALLLVAVALLLPTAANAQLTMQMSNGWAFTFTGNVNAFWVFTKQTKSGPANSSVRTGLLPAFAQFEAKGKEKGVDLGVHFGFAPQINTGGAHDNFIATSVQAGAQIDMREVWLTIGGEKWGQLLAGRALGLFSRQNIVQDMTLFGVGAVGVGGGQARGTTLGRIGYGYIYPNFVSQLTYSSPAKNPVQISIGAFEPSVVGSSPFQFTAIPRVESEVTWHRETGSTKWLVWANGVWQYAQTAPAVAPAVRQNISSFGGSGGIKGSIQDFSFVVNAYIGRGLGTLLMFSDIAGGGVAAGGTKLRTSDGGYAQLGYTFNKKTTLGGSWGFSRLKNNATAVASGGDGNTNVRTQFTSYTVGIYHQWSKSLKLVGEGTREQQGVGGAAPAQIDVSGGFMLFF